MPDPWTHGDYTSAENMPPGTVQTFFPGRYELKLLQVQGTKEEKKIFVPLSEWRTPESQATVVAHKIGCGCIAYNGNVSKEINC